MIIKLYIRTDVYENINSVVFTQTKNMIIFIIKKEEIKIKIAFNGKWIFFVRQTKNN